MIRVCLSVLLEVVPNILVDCDPNLTLVPMNGAVHSLESQRAEDVKHSETALVFN